jgi:drug/metabolite transporter (DMT)-like permease
LLIKVAVVELEPTFLVFARLAMAALVLAPIAVASGALRRVSQKWRRLVLIGVVGIVAPFLLVAYGEQHITSSLAALLVASDPLFIVLLAFPFDPSERPTGVRMLGLILGFLGVGVLVGLDVGGDAQGVLGAVMLLLAALFYALSALLVKGLRGVPMLGSVSATLTVASVVLAPVALINLPTRMPGQATLISLVTLGLACTALAYVLYFNLIAEAGASRASIITYVNPAVAVLLGALILSEPITPGTIAGFVLILIGCALATGLVRGPRGSGRPRRISGAELAEGEMS